MTFHVYSQWTINDPIEDAPVKDIAYGIKSHNYAQPPCFGVFSISDAILFNTTMFLVRNQGQVLTQELVEKFIDESEGVGEHREKLIELMVLVLQELELFNEAFTEDKKKPVHFEHSEQFKKAEAELAADPAFKDAVGKIVKDLREKGKSETPLGTPIETLPGTENLGNNEYGILKDKIVKGLSQPNDDILRN